MVPVRTVSEIPREGDLKDSPPAAHNQLIALRNEMHAAAGTEPTQLDAAIDSGSRVEVVRALQEAQIRTEFGRLRDQIEATRISVGNVTDQTVVYGEQAARRLTAPDIVPNWLKFGAITGGATWLLSRVVGYPVKWVTGNDAMIKWGNKAALAVGAIAGGTKAVMDVANSGTSTGDAIARQVPLLGLVRTNDTPGQNLAAREKRIVDSLSATQWQQPVTNNVFVLPAISLSELPISMIRMTHYANGAAQLTTELLETNADPRYKLSSATNRQFGTAANVDKVTIQFSLAGETTMRPNPPITIDKPRA